MWGVGAPSACHARTAMCCCIVALAVDVFPDQKNVVIGKSFWHWDATTQQHPAKGSCLGEHGHLERWWEVSRLGETLPQRKRRLRDPIVTVDDLNSPPVSSNQSLEVSSVSLTDNQHPSFSYRLVKFSAQSLEVAGDFRQKRASPLPGIFPPLQQLYIRGKNRKCDDCLPALLPVFLDVSPRFAVAFAKRLPCSSCSG